MLTEYQVRQRIELIRELHIAPLRKARLLLEIGRSLDKQAQSLILANDHLERSHDPNGSASLTRISTRARALHEDVRDAAHEALTTDA